MRSGWPRTGRCPTSARARTLALASLALLAPCSRPGGGGGPDDDTASDPDELDTVGFAGPATRGRAREGAVPARGASGAVTTDVVFSPAPAAASHNARLAGLIGAARRSLDIALYDVSEDALLEALAQAVARHVAVRLVLDTAREDRKLEGEARLRSTSGRLERAGVDVRYDNKTVHHKFVLADGPRDELARAYTAELASGSANWSASAATRYDENTLFLRGHAELALRLQAEFNLLWDHSRDFALDPPIAFEPSEIAIGAAELAAVEGPDCHAYMTSNNFDAVGDTFRGNGGNAVSDRLIAAIEGARTSIWVASGHLRHRGVAAALVAARAGHPGLDVRVYLDGQEYISAAAHARQLAALTDCLAAAGDDANARRECLERGFKFGYQVGQADVLVRYKFYAYRWDYSYALQMHHKYMIIDGDELWTGSYNLSDNAEHNALENMLVFRGPAHAGLVAAYRANFERIWDTGRAGDALGALRAEIGEADVIPIVFAPMALTWPEVRDLKALIRDQCPAVDSHEFRVHPERHFVCLTHDTPSGPVLPEGVVGEPHTAHAGQPSGLGFAGPAASGR